VAPSLHCDCWIYFENPYFWSGFVACLVAQTLKLLLGALRKKCLDFTNLVTTGGMPSAHSALVTSIFASFGMGLGWAHPLTVLSSTVATITMFDAATVRRAAGQQARLLNKMMRRIVLERKFSFQPLKEMLGHTRVEVFGGIGVGILAALLVMRIWVWMGWPNLTF